MKSKLPKRYTPEESKANLKILVRGAYDIQKLRIEMGNRIVANFKSKLGIKPGEKEKENKLAKEILDKLRASYKKLTDGVKTFPRDANFTGDGLISTYTELCLVAQYVGLENSEKKHFHHLGTILKGFPIYSNYLVDIKGVGPAMAGVIISEVDIEKCEYPSGLWRYAGLDVADDGKGRSKRQEHLIDIEYVTKDGEVKLRKGITFNPFLKTKLMGVLSSSFLRAGGEYSEIYYKYKHRLENHAEHKHKSKGHRHNMALRYMVKIFLLKLHPQWRKMARLPISSPYHEAKLALVHSA